MGVDCRNWDEDTYRHTILQERETQCRTVFRTAFAPSPNPNPDLIVAASSDGSIASYSISSLALDFSNGRGQNSLLARPQRLLQGHDGPAYDVKFCGNGENSLLLSCGDDGRIRGWRWKEFSNREGDSPLQGGHLKPILDLVNPQYKGPWGSLSPIPESNAIAVDNQGESIFSASGDCCAYCWDVERSEMKMVFKGHSDYLHCIVARNSGNQIVTGSEDGTARIWDCRSGKCVQVIDLVKDRKLKESHVSCIALDASESWLACGNGQNLSVWNLPARECISTIPTRASIQDAVFDGNQILAVGAEPSLSRIDMNGAVISQIQCAPQSAFSISLHPTGVAAVAGYGGLVDVISQFGSHLCTFRC
ncbi:THO complex subunit 6 isoform X1 [Rhododendron vialii]|uniref:THO complex subunit 6 isoform X1 n=2 Tax=Rhododendron vialii TaxID=182163 RepID=UPI00265EB7B3|nr:THO complex subunit 6 isoform X1 [Rhododendron vialii]